MARCGIVASMRIWVIALATAFSMPLRAPCLAETASLSPVNQTTSAATAEMLGDRSGWIWKKPQGNAGWHKLIPGCCAQWRLDGQGFYYFLNVGYDGTRSELWSADSNGEARLRITRSDYYVQRSPIVSPDGKYLVFQYSTCRASGNFQDVVVVDVRRLTDAPVDGRVIFRTKDPIDALRWDSPTTVAFILNGVEQRAVIFSAGMPQIP
jgi:hypothetical protein